MRNRRQDLVTQPHSGAFADALTDQELDEVAGGTTADTKPAPKKIPPIVIIAILIGM